MAFSPPIVTTVPISAALPVMPTSQMPVPVTILPVTQPLPQPQVQLSTIQVAPMSDHCYEELKVEMDAQATLIAVLIGKKDKESTKATKRLRPLANEVYSEVLPEKYKQPSFTEFDGNGNPWDHITIFEIECGMIA